VGRETHPRAHPARDGMVHRSGIALTPPPPSAFPSDAHRPGRGWRP
jgi:hypothetical protein